MPDFIGAGTVASVVSTDPSNNENNVPIDKGKVIIKFSKPMDENTTEAAISIIGTNGNGVPIDSFAWEDSNNGNTGVRKRLPKNFNMYRIS
ncbi:Ig-like domain-containing protein [candidate division WOR-3 bacterium]|nr:Ig-like domain-containing protein [candidate division WOR-3 bacterium]